MGIAGFLVYGMATGLVAELPAKVSGDSFYFPWPILFWHLNYPCAPNPWAAPHQRILEAYLLPFVLGAGGVADGPSRWARRILGARQLTRYAGFISSLVAGDTGAYGTQKPEGVEAGVVGVAP